MQGPFFKIKEKLNWTGVEGLSEDAIMLITKTYDKATKSKKSMSCVLSIKSKDDSLFCTVDDLKSNYLIDLSTNTRYPLQNSIEYKYWDYIYTFKPFSTQSVDNGNFYRVKNLIPGLFEYEFVEKMFKNSFNSNSYNPRSYNLFGTGFGG